MRSTDFCNRLTTRAPCQAVRFPSASVRPRSDEPCGPTPQATVARATRPPRNRACARSMRTDDPPGGSSFDDEEPASTKPRPKGELPLARRVPLDRAPRVPGEPRSKVPRRDATPRGVIHREKHRARSLASDVATRPLDDAFRRRRATGPPNLARNAASSKTAIATRFGRLPPTKTLSPILSRCGPGGHRPLAAEALTSGPGRGTTRAAPQLGMGSTKASP